MGKKKRMKASDDQINNRDEIKKQKIKKHIQDEIHVTSTKKHKKEINLNSLDSSEINVSYTVKNKKNKKSKESKENSSDVSETIPVYDDNLASSSQKKVKRSKKDKYKNDKFSLSERVSVGCVDNNISNSDAHTCITLEQKNKKKDRNTGDNAKETKLDIIEKECTKTKKKKKKRKHVDVMEEKELQDPTESNIVASIVKKKKKKIKHKDIPVEEKGIDCIDSSEIDAILNPRKKRKISIHLEANSGKYCDTNGKQQQLANKKGVEAKCKSPQKVKQYNNKKIENVIDKETKIDTGISICETTDSTCRKHKKKKKQKADSSGCAVEGSPKKNSDNHKDTNLENELDAPLHGQWGTAQFENNDRQQKFLRLLGAFKSDLKTATKEANIGRSANALKFNMALNKKREEGLNKSLQGQFERALEFRKPGKGNIGLGYTPPPGEGKKFYIDVGKQKSTKFDD